MEKNALLNHEIVMSSSDKTTNNFIGAFLSTKPSKILTFRALLKP